MTTSEDLYLEKKHPMANAAWLTAQICFAIALADAIAGLVAGIGYRLDLWGYRDGLGALPYVFWLAVGTGVLSALAILVGAISGRRGAVVVGVLALLTASITAYIPWNLRQAARSVPPIHDITTDFDNPPQFVRIIGTRKKTDHPASYDGPEVAAQQKKAYPDIAPVIVKAAPDKAFEASRQVLMAMGLEIIDAEPIQGRIEATDRSLLFGFEDDVVLRLVPGADGSTKVDMRSKSRVGRSDLGINAHRVREFASGLRRKLGS
jgi:uncharacterized protein (DUF1499 family)